MSYGLLHKIAAEKEEKAKEPGRISRWYNSTKDYVVAHPKTSAAAGIAALGAAGGAGYYYNKRRKEREAEMGPEGYGEY